MTTLYILHSQELEKYYCGITEMTIEERLKRHLYDHGGYTAQVKDWQCIHTEIFENKTDALKKEKQIKKRGIKRYFEALSG